MSSLDIDLSTDKAVALSQLTRFLRIDELTEKKKKILEDAIDDAQNETILRLFSFSDQLPFTDPILLKAHQQAQFYYVVWAWKQEKHLKEDADAYEKKYNSKIKFIEKALRSIPTDRQKTVLISTDPREKKTILPTQAGIFAFDEF